MGTGTRSVASSGRSFRATAQAGHQKGWSAAIVCILLYFFVIHSGRLDVGSLAIAGGLGFLLLEGREIRVPPFLLWFAAFLGWTLLASFVAIDTARSYERWWDYGKFWLIAFLIYNAIRSERQWRLVSVGWLAMFALFPFRGIVFNFVTGSATQGRYAWNFSFRNPNDYAAIALLILTLAIITARAAGPRWIRACAWIGVAGVTMAILITGSRAGLLGTVVIASVLTLYSKQRVRIVAMTLATAIIVFPFVPERTKARFSAMRFLTSRETIVQADEWGSAEERRVILDVALAVARDNPLFGVGLGNYPLANERYALQRPEWAAAQGRRDSHNTYATLAAETGILGLLLASAGVLSVVITAWRFRGMVAERLKRLPDDVNAARMLHGTTALMAGVAGYATTCFFGSYVYYAFPYLFLALAARYPQAELAVAAVSSRRKRQSRRSRF